MNKRGQTNLVGNFMNILIMVMVIVGIIAVIFGIALGAPLLIGNANTLNEEVTSAFQDANIQDIDTQNATGIATDTVRGTLGTMQFIMYAVFIGLILGYLVICFYMKSQPWLIFAWVFIMLFMVIISMFIANSYITAAENPVNEDFYDAWGSSDFVMRYLPHIMATLGVIGGIFLLVLYPRDEYEGGAAL